jgi:UDP-N-acetylmuramoyl-tripeptide--D-alanyl-D-alanine ligase
LFGKGKEYDVFVGEYGIDMVGEMKQLIDVVAPDIAIVTRIDAVHGMQMGGVEQIAEEKGLLVAHAKDIVYLNTDDYRVVAMAQRSLTDIFRYGSSSEATHSIDEVTYHRE